MVGAWKAPDMKTGMYICDKLIPYMEAQSPEEFQGLKLIFLVKGTSSYS